jgi:hypothetical protein
MILGAHNRSKRGNSKTGDSTQHAIGQFQEQQQDAMVYM